jgi:hypothetical protein
MQIILTKTDGYINGTYSFRTADQSLIGEAFDATTQRDFVAQLDKFRAALPYAPLGLAQPYETDLSPQSASFIAKQPA